MGSENKAPRLTRTILEAISSSLAAALAGEGFDGGDFEGLNPDHFELAQRWVDAQLAKRSRGEHRCLGERISTERLEIKKAIMLEVQCHDFGSALPDGNFRCTSAQIDLLDEVCGKAADRVIALHPPAPVSAVSEEIARRALSDWERHACVHENTYRGGFIWTICDDCGRKWADDEGGFQPYADPPGIADLRAALSRLAPPPAPVSEDMVGLREENARLREALQQFVDRVPDAAMEFPDGTLAATTGIDVGLFRRARAALSKGEQG